MDFFLCAQCLAQSRSSRDPIGIQSGSSRDPVGIQSGSSRDPVVNSSREFAPYWNSDEFVSKVQLEKKSCGIFWKKRIHDWEITHAGQQKRIPDWIDWETWDFAGGSLVRVEVGGRKLDFGRKKPGGAWQKAALRPERCEKGWCSRSSCAWRLTGQARLRGSMSYACACKIFGVAFCRRPEFQCCWAQKPLLACCRCLVIQHCWTREAARKRLGGCSGCGPLLARRSFFPSLRGGCASVVFTSDPPAPPIFQCCLQVVTANLLSHVRKTTLTFGGAGMGLQLCNFCPVSASLTNRRVAPSAEVTHSRAWIWGRFFMRKMAPLGRGLRGASEWRMGQLNSVAQSCLQNVLSRGREGGELFGKKFATSFEKISRRGIFDAKNGTKNGSAWRTQFWGRLYIFNWKRPQFWVRQVRRSCCFGDDVCKCEVAAARGVNCVDAPRVVCWCTEKVFWGIELYTKLSWIHAVSHNRGGPSSAALFSLWFCNTSFGAAFPTFLCAGARVVQQVVCIAFTPLLRALGSCLAAMKSTWLCAFCALLLWLS